MALTQTHIDLRSSVSNKLIALAAEKAALADDVARNTAIGTISGGDGGAASTGEAAVVVAAFSELLSAAAGDADFGGVSPTFNGTTITGGNVGTAKIAVAVVADVLASPLVSLRPVIPGTDIDVSAWVTVAATSSKVLADGLVHPQSTISLGIIPAGATAAFNAAYKLVVENPLDLTSSETVSTGSATFIYAG